MRLSKYFQSYQYSKNPVAWRKNVYYPLRFKFIGDQMIFNEGANLLDVGCGRGQMAKLLKTKHPGVNIMGLDIDDGELQFARDENFCVQPADLNQTWPVDNEKFDYVIAHEVLEHIFNPDMFLREAFRCLKPGGRLIITTPNLVAWHQRILVMLGCHPFFYELSTEKRDIGLGWINFIMKNQNPVGHIRVFTGPAFKDLAHYHRFENIKIVGSPIPFLLSTPANFVYDAADGIFSIFKTLASNLLIVAQKPL